MLWNLIGTIGGKVLDIVDDGVEDKDEANKLKFQIERQHYRGQKRGAGGQAKIVLARLREAGFTQLQIRETPKLVLT